MGQLAPPGLTERLTRYLTEVRKASSEAGKAFLYLELVRDVFGQLDMDYLERLFPELEKQMKFQSRTLMVRGRSDAFLGNVIIEFKIALDGASRETAEGELKKYVAVLWSKQSTNRVAYVTVATDGINCIVFRPRTSVPLGQEVSPEEVKLDAIDQLALDKAEPGRVFVWLDRYLLHKTLRPATAEDISEEFGLDRSAYSEAVPLIKEAWEEIKERTLYDQWASYLRIVYGSKVESEELFLRHAYLATLAKLMAYATLSGGALPISEREIVRIIEGELFSHDWGIRNFVEEDFFTWITRTRKGIAATENLLARISGYDLTRIDEDILKGLYQGLVDAKERHDLGEYYTPDWLSEYIVSKTLENRVEESALDPACGSGTFLAAAIRAKKRLLSNKMHARAVLENILESVAGIDVHPLAVIMARTTYLLSVGTELLNVRAGEIGIPVYMADSIRLPEEEQTNLEGIACVAVNADGIKLRVPSVMIGDPMLIDPAIDTAKQYAKLILAGEVPSEQEISNELSRQNSTMKDLLRSERGDAVVRVILHLAQDMAKLIEAKKDTIWAFILKNKYKPFYLKDKKTHFIIGNPPWLSYRYVESTEYQAFLKHAIVAEHKLLPKSEVELITHMELGTLVFVRCASLYLGARGKIAFVLPRSIFTADQHDSFRSMKFSPPLVFEEILDLEQVKPLFKVPSCVVVARKEA